MMRLRRKKSSTSSNRVPPRKGLQWTHLRREGETAAGEVQQGSNQREKDSFRQGRKSSKSLAASTALQLSATTTSSINEKRRGDNRRQSRKKKSSVGLDPKSSNCFNPNISVRISPSYIKGLTTYPAGQACEELISVDSTVDSAVEEDELARVHFLDDPTDLAVDQEAFRYTFQDHLTRLLKKNTNECKSKSARKSLVIFTTQQKEELASCINQDYTEILLDQSYLGRHGVVEAHLGAANHILNQFFAVQDLIHRIAAMPATTQESIFLVVEDYIRPRITDHYSSSVNKLTPEEATKVIRWIDSFLDGMRQVCPDVPIRESWVDDLETLIQYYLEKAVRQELRGLLEQAMSLHCADDVRQETEGTLVTGLPEQIGFMMDQQIRVAQQLLPDRYLPKVQAVCNNELSICVGNWQLKIGSGWKEMRASYHCAIINDACRLVDQVEADNVQFLEGNQHTVTLYQLTGEAVVDDLTEMSLYATKYLCERIMLDLREPDPILTTVGDQTWENPSECLVVDRTISTLRDYLGDVEEWLDHPDYYYPKVLKGCFDVTLNTYLESFFANTMAHGVKNPVRASEELQQDYLRLVVFFTGTSCEKFHGKGGFYTQSEINDRLRVLHSMHVLVNPSTQPDEAIEDIQSILESFPDEEQGSAAVLHLAGLRRRYRHFESVQWLQAIAIAQKRISSSRRARQTVSSSASSSYHGPDVRNSKYMHNLRPRVSALSRDISAAILPFTENTSRLLRIGIR